MAIAHTPGPWRALPDGTIVAGPNGRHIAKAATTGMGYAAGPNAALLAAAPDLLFFARQVAVALPDELGALIHEAHTLIARTEIQS